MKNSNRTHDLLVCSAVPQPTVPPRTSLLCGIRVLMLTTISHWIMCSNVQEERTDLPRDTRSGARCNEPHVLLVLYSLIQICHQCQSLILTPLSCACLS